MNNLDKYYKLAFEYKNKKLWKKMDENHVFAIKLDDGKIGLISIMGSNGQYNAISLYTGSESILYFRDIFEIEGHVSDYDKFLSSLDHYNYQLVLGNKDDITSNEANDIRDYKKRNSINIRGALSMPHFRKTTPFSPLSEFNKDSDYHYIEQALKACMALAELLEENSLDDLGIKIMPEADKLILFEKINGKYLINGEVDLDWKNDDPYIRASVVRMDIAKKLKRIKNKTDIECKLTVVTAPVNEENSNTYYPQFILALENNSGTIIPIRPVKNYREDPNTLVNDFFESIVNVGLKPVKIRANDKRTYYLLEKICKSLKIDLILDENLEQLDLLREEFDSKMSAGPGGGTSSEEIMMEILGYLKALEDIKEKRNEIPDEVIYSIAQSLLIGDFE
ncbi:hypothetical protein NH286_08285 [Anaerococcus sp. NML200574]|uniref:DUF6930 domain-containing protein n=1 Tax=Anaerococcus sp. NML200574 TaxID=2954486 RepID=UPI00223780D5|nr:hypothetical protein [Anaerococcus sp. NML200574]MCW6679151.1 hypothetical protein [Anaerococcus sp. NML200574]